MYIPFAFEIEPFLFYGHSALIEMFINHKFSSVYTLYIHMQHS